MLLSMPECRKYVDLDASGNISAKELERTLSMWNLPVPREILQRLVLDADTNHDGTVSDPSDTAVALKDACLECMLSCFGRTPAMP